MPLHQSSVSTYVPLIDMSPAEPDTILTAMVESQRLTTMQLYCIAVNMTWVYPDLFQNFISRLGGMHTLMSFAGSVGTLMADSGLENILQAAFGGVAKMSGKNFPQNMRALRLVAEELLRYIISTNLLMAYVIGLLQRSDTYLIFDRYYADSIKNATRSTRAVKKLADAIS